MVLKPMRKINFQLSFLHLWQGDVNVETVFAKIDEVKAHASEKYKDDPVTLNRILVALNEYKEQVQLKGNSTEGFVKGLERFEAQNH